jgi:hypothetical protein
MNTFKLGTALTRIALAAGVLTSACVADRPSRNGVFNENQYVRKDFLIHSATDQNGNLTTDDPGWLLRSTVTETSTPNLLGGGIDVWGGLNTDVKLVRWRVTSDKLQMLDQVQLSTPQNPDATTGAPGAVNTTSTTAAIINAWPATNVDLKYRVNLDGEKTNYYEENQELDWQVRQWVKLTFDKNDLSDFQPLGPVTNDLLAKCADLVDASATLVPGSFNVINGSDPNGYDDYMEFTVSIAAPLSFDTTTDTVCVQAYQPILANALKVNRTTVTVNLKYSFKRAVPTTDTKNYTYTPFVLAEKDPIHYKYGPFLYTVFDRDNADELLAANQYVGRFDPAKPIVWYFDQNFPEYYKPIFDPVNFKPKGSSPNVTNMSTQQGIAQGTNQVLQASGAAARVQFFNYNDDITQAPGNGNGPTRAYGDVRYNFLRWASDQDLQGTFAGVTMPGFDPRSGEIINENIEFNDFAVKDYYVARINAFLTTVTNAGGLTGTWNTGSCKGDQVMPLVNASIITNHDANSTVFSKMQTYLNLHGPDPSNDHLGPSDFTAAATEDADFYRAYFALAPYEVFADPDMNLFVTREGGNGVYGPASLEQLLRDEYSWEQLTAQINNGQEPYDTTGGPLAAATFAEQMKTLTTSHNRLPLVSAVLHPEHMDTPDTFSLETVMEQDGQRCVNGSWESQDSWVQHIIDTYWQQVFWHEFGHSMGLEHNFMGNIDSQNFTVARDSNGNPQTDANGSPLYEMYSSSIMEYSAAPARLAWTQGWGNYDKGAIAWIYANNARQPDNTMKDATALSNKNTSGEVIGTSRGGEYPFKDPLGFCYAGDKDCTMGTERAFLRCDETHLTYSPMCRQGDLGVTPSQIVANNIDNYEWQFQWRNFRDYRKVWDESTYATGVAGFITDNRRFLSQWAFDWSPGELSTTLYRIGVTPPTSLGAVSNIDYYNQLTYKFLVEMSKTASMVGAYDEAVIQQSAGERPFATVYDKFYGDVTQQGIILDKYFAMQDFVGLWQSNNYDQNQAGAYLSTWGNFDFDNTFQSIAETAVTSMIGSQYAVYPYFIPTAVALFAADTHNPAYLNGGGRVEAKDWIGGWTFTREQDMIDFFKNVVVNAVATGIPAAASAGAPCTAMTPANGVCGCNLFETCNYDVTNSAMTSPNAQTQAFVAPDGLTYAYALIPSRNNWQVARSDRNIVMYKLITTYNTDIYATKDDGTQGAYGYEYQMKYTIDAYNAFEFGGGFFNPPPPATSSN